MNALFDHYESLFETAPHISLLSLSDLTIVAVSNAFLAATKTNRNDIVGKTIFEVFNDGHGDINSSSLQSLRNSLEKVIRWGVPDHMPAQKYQLHLPGSIEGCIEEFYWKSLNTPLLLGPEPLLYILINIEDITTQIKSGEYGKELQLEAVHQFARINEIEREISERSLELKEANKQLHQVSEELQKLSYITSHDLKSHLRGINTLTQWINIDYGDKLNEAGKKQFALLQERIQRMFKLIEGVLTYSSVKAENKKYGKKVNLNCVVQDVLAELKVPENIQINVIVVLPTVSYNKNYLNQVFMQLLQNAIFFNNKPKGIININAIDNEKEWIISVEDNGKGIDCKYHEKIFQLFQTLDNHYGNSNTGVGLAIVKKIIEGYGGRVWLESKTEAGCKFYFTIIKR